MLPQKKAITLQGAVNTLISMGFVLDLDNGFLVHGVEHRLDVIDDQVTVKGDKGRTPWVEFVRTLRPR
ncbi:hypothetical protein [Roseomonas fluvialis]|uniref:Uncharacterized protein n=1 Tax=Roseomonas fluvialis TaxID=1750527 RepID=A0ABN6NZX9_9PROT|nr:hypothetical protein [Roseomonas fluvialis]BDG71980.1 hypothetical protein Rmf_19090 [Roseomonas fluvialis]